MRGLAQTGARGEAKYRRVRDNNEPRTPKSLDTCKTEANTLQTTGLLERTSLFTPARNINPSVHREASHH